MGFISQKTYELSNRNSLRFFFFKLIPKILFRIQFNREIMPACNSARDSIPYMQDIKHEVTAILSKCV